MVNFKVLITNINNRIKVNINKCISYIILIKTFNLISMRVIKFQSLMVK